MDASVTGSDKPKGPYRAHPDVVWRDVGGEIVLLNVETGHYFGLDQVGGRVWALLQAAEGGLTLEALATAVRLEFEVDPPTATADLTALIADLEAHHLVIAG
jgi:hypothetical protein